MLVFSKVLSTLFLLFVSSLTRIHQASASLLDESSETAASFAAFESDISDKYAHQIFLGSNSEVAVFWEVDGDTLRLAVAAAATGWVAFGISDTGAMKGADIVAFEAATGELNDYHSLDYVRPQLDDCENDWTLVSKVSDDSTFIAFEATRLINTGDTQDIALLDDSELSTPTTHIMSAWGDQEALSFHGPNKVARGSIRFFRDDGASSEKSNLEVLRETAEGSIVMTAGNYTVPMKDSHYHLRCVNIVDIPGVVPGEPINIIGMTNSPSFDNNGVDTTKYIHHFGVLGVYGNCPRNLESSFRRTFYVWTPGREPFVLPPQVSLPLSGDTKYKSIMLHIHYTNPWGDKNVVDDSGIELFSVKEPREMEAELMMVGGAPDPYGFDGTPIPQGASKHEISCPSSCFKSNLPTPVTVFAEGLHLHTNGARIVSQHLRDGKVINEAASQSWDYYQTGNWFAQQKPYQIIPGRDSRKLFCYYDTPHNDTVFGQGTHEEMCVNMVWYYPASNQGIGFCGPNFPVPSCKADYNGTTDVAEDFGRTFGTPHTATSTCPVKDKAVENTATTTPGAVACFAGQNLVLTPNRGHVRMDDLRIGDMVDVGGDKFSRIYSFGHYTNTTVTEYLQLHTSAVAAATGQDIPPIEISKEHMLFVVGHRDPIPASMVVVGDELLLSASAGGATSSSRVTRITTVKRIGAFAPFTETGTIAVSGIVASSYISLQTNAESAVGGVVSVQWLSHAYLAPRRMACRAFGIQFCSKEAYTNDGIAKWLTGPHVAATWLLEQQREMMVVRLMYAALVLVGIGLNIMEYFFDGGVLLSVCLAVLGIIVVSRSKNMYTTTKGVR